MKILLDEGLPRRAADRLRKDGLDAIHVLEVGLGGAADDRLLEYARQEKAIVVCFDSDFHKILARTGAVSPSVVRLRVEGLRHEALADLIGIIIKESGEALERGAAVSATSESIRIHHLPIGSAEQLRGADNEVR